MVHGKTRETLSTDMIYAEDRQATFQRDPWWVKICDEAINPTLEECLRVRKMYGIRNRYLAGLRNTTPEGSIKRLRHQLLFFSTTCFRSYRINREKQRSKPVDGVYFRRRKVCLY